MLQWKAWREGATSLGKHAVNISRIYDLPMGFCMLPCVPSTLRFTDIFLVQCFIGANGT